MIPVQEIKNEEILLVNVIKWLVLSVIAGALTGALIALFLFLLRFCIEIAESWLSWRYALIPVGLLLSFYAVRLIAPAAEGRGTDKVIAAFHYRAARVPFMVIPAKILSTIFTLAPGGVVGTEGPSVQIGAGFTSALSIALHFSEKERKKLVICGVSAALSAVLGAPIAGAIFGVEVLFVGSFFYPILLPAVISSIASYFVCVALGVSYAVPDIVIPPLSLEMFVWCLGAAVFFSFVCIYHVEMVHGIGRLFKKMNVPMPVKSFISAGILLSAAAIFGDSFLGMGDKGLNSILSGQPQPWYAFLLKSVLLGVTLSGGGSGGVQTPTFFIGAAAGSLFAGVFGLDIGFFGALGFVACIAGAVNTPLAATFMAVELFGNAIAPYAGAVCIICYMLTGLRSLYPTQVLVQPKSDAFILAEPSNRQSWKVQPRKAVRKKFPSRKKKAKAKSN
ncbi:MAG: chloride channel protein [Alphaproteobacteria bacterium]|nr:chloride channel protein [Alphaproteobacteria bacterium]